MQFKARERSNKTEGGNSLIYQYDMHFHLNLKHANTDAYNQKNAQTAKHAKTLFQPRTASVQTLDKAVVAYSFN